MTTVDHKTLVATMTGISKFHLQMRLRGLPGDQDYICPDLIKVTDRITNTIDTKLVADVIWNILNAKREVTYSYLGVDYVASICPYFRSRTLYLTRLDVDRTIVDTKYTLGIRAVDGRIVVDTPTGELMGAGLLIDPYHIETMLKGHILQQFELPPKVYIEQYLAKLYKVITMFPHLLEDLGANVQHTGGDEGHQVKITMITTQGTYHVEIKYNVGGQYNGDITWYKLVGNGDSRYKIHPSSYLEHDLMIILEPMMEWRLPERYYQWR